MTDQICSRCGAPIVAGAHFCSRCGHDVSGEQAVLATAKMAAPPPPPRATPAEPASEILEPLRRATTGEYDIAGELGRGGMATVFLAHDIALDRKVAIKVMTPSLVTGAGMVERFKREARTAASLSHPHIIPIYAVKETGNLLFFVMKFVEGRSLDTIIRHEGALPIPMVQAILAQVGGALGYAHRRGIVHRDIKPANIMLDEEGWAVVTDFGIAKVADARGLTMTGVTIGTPTYMSPEQCASKEITGATDQYSLGIVAFELLTGRIPFDAESLMGIMWKHFNEPPPPIHDFRPDCPEPVAGAITRMLAKAPADRWPTLEDAIAAIGQPPMAPGDPIRGQMRALASGSAGAALRDSVHTPASPIPAGTGASPDAPTMPSGPTAVPSGLQAPPLTPPPISKHVTEAPTVVTGDGPTIVSSEAATIVTSDVPAAPPAPATRPFPPAQAPRPTPAAAQTPPKRGLVWGLGLAGLAAASALAVWGVLAIRAPAGTDAATDTGAVALPEGPPPAPVAGVRLTPESQSMAVGASADLLAFLVDSANNPLGNRTIDWESSDPTIATVQAGAGVGGVVTGLKAGRVRIVALSEGKADTATVTVTAVRAAVASVAVQLQSQELAPGDTVPVATLVQDASGGNLGGRPVQLASSNPQVIRIVESRLVALGEGTANIVASSEGVQSPPTAVRVTIPPVQTVAISGPRALDQGGSSRLGIAIRDARGRPVSGQSPTWRSSNPRIATVSADGTVEAVGEGQATITATVAGVSGDLALTVRPPARVAVDQIRLSRQVASLEVGGSASVGASAIAPGGQTLLDRDVAWQSSNPGVATVDRDGTITARSAGTTTITASSEGKSRSFELTVTAPAPPPTTVDEVKPPPPVTAPAANAVAAAALGAGADFTCATLSDGSAACWGSGAPRPAGATGLQRVVAGNAHACGLAGNGAVFCWGNNTNGQLGSGEASRETVTRAVRVATDLRFKAITAGASHTCAIATDGSAWCWGRNNDAQLGNNSTRDQPAPVAVERGLTYMALAAGEKHTCGVAADGKVFCWGDGFANQLGIGITEQRRTPDEARMREPATSIFAGRNSTCAIGVEGNTYCWGSAFGSTPRRVESDQQFTRLAVGDEFACGLTAAGAAWCWGKNNRGQLGDGSGKDQRQPVRVATSEPLADITAGTAHACAITRAGPTLCWGDNGKGQVGTGTGEPARTPVSVEIRR